VGPLSTHSSVFDPYSPRFVDAKMLSAKPTNACCDPRTCAHAESYVPVSGTLQGTTIRTESNIIWTMEPLRIVDGCAICRTAWLCAVHVQLLKPVSPCLPVSHT
jgi:hypothetical protein